jgi:ribosome assembly protein 1
LKQAYNENLKTVLFLNKIDRLILEKKMTTAEVYKQLTQIIEQVNAVIGNIFASDIISKDVLNTNVSAKKGVLLPILG